MIRISILRNKLISHNNKIKQYFIRIKSDASERNRFLILSLTLLFLADYLMFCYISDRNPFNIFPAMPLIENKKIVNIYIPDIDGKTILKETRELSIPDDREGYIKLLIQKCISGSNIDNTSTAVPSDMFVRKVWFYNETCIIDFIPSLLEKKFKTIPGSEVLFKNSLEKTIKDNIPEIKNIALLERGIPGRGMWED